VSCCDQYADYAHPNGIEITTRLKVESAIGEGMASGLDAGAKTIARELESLSRSLAVRKTAQ
jgi:hypothetical protein